jgi:ankyrin repeat protein
MMMSESPPRTSNLWDRIPTELKNQIVSKADQLTQFLNGHLNDQQLACKPSLGFEIWQTAFELDWQGDLSLLPRSYLPNVQQGLMAVHTRSMYDRLCRLAPEKVNFPDWKGKDLRYIDTTPSEFINIPLRMCWLDSIVIPSNQPFDNIVMYAAHGGHVEYIRHIVTSGEYQPNDSTSNVGFQGDTLSAMGWAARSGRLELVEYLREQGCHVDSNAIQHAAWTGHLHLIEYLYPDHSTMFTAWAFEGAAASGNFDLVKFCHEHDVPCGESAMDKAAAWGHLKILKYIHNKRSLGCTKYGMMFAARSGYYEVVKFLHTTFNCEVDLAPLFAASHGHLEIVTYLMENYPDDCRKCLHVGRIIRDASSSFVPFADDKILLVIKYLHKIHYDHAFQVVDLPDDEVAPRCNVSIAAHHGLLQVLKFLIEVRAETVDEDAIGYASRGGHLDIVEYLHFNTLASCTTDAIDAAAWMGHLDVVKFLHENRKEGCTWRAMDAAAGSGHLEVVKFLHENRTEGCTWKAINEAVLDRHVKIVRYLLENRNEGYTVLAIENAKVDRQFDIVGLLESYPEKMVKAEELESE